MISYQDFENVEIRVGKVIRTEDFPQARKPAYKIWIDFGEWGIKKSSAQLTGLYKKEELVDRLIVAVTNFPPRQIANFQSEVLILGLSDEDGNVSLLSPDHPIPLGNRVF